MDNSTAKVLGACVAGAILGAMAVIGYGKYLYTKQVKEAQNGK